MPPVWPILTVYSVKITAQKQQAKPEIQNFDRHRSKFRSKLRNFDRKSVKITQFWPKIGQNWRNFDRRFGKNSVKIPYFNPYVSQNSKFWPPYPNFDRISVKFRSKFCRQLFCKDNCHLNQLRTNFYNNAEPIYQTCFDCRNKIYIINYIQTTSVIYTTHSWPTFGSHHHPHPHPHPHLHPHPHHHLQGLAEEGVYSRNLQPE